MPLSRIYMIHNLNEIHQIVLIQIILERLPVGTTMTLCFTPQKREYQQFMMVGRMLLTQEAESPGALYLKFFLIF